MKQTNTQIESYTLYPLNAFTTPLEKAHEELVIAAQSGYACREINEAIRATKKAIEQIDRYTARRRKAGIGNSPILEDKNKLLNEIANASAEQLQVTFLHEGGFDSRLENDTTHVIDIVNFNKEAPITIYTLIKAYFDTKGIDTHYFLNDEPDESNQSFTINVTSPDFDEDFSNHATALTSAIEEMKSHSYEINKDTQIDIKLVDLNNNETIKIEIPDYLVFNPYNPNFKPTATNMFFHELMHWLNDHGVQVLSYNTIPGVIFSFGFTSVGAEVPMVDMNVVSQQISKMIEDYKDRSFA